MTKPKLHLCAPPPIPSHLSVLWAFDQHRLGWQAALDGPYEGLKLDDWPAWLVSQGVCAPLPRGDAREKRWCRLRDVCYDLQEKGWLPGHPRQRRRGIWSAWAKPPRYRTFLRLYAVHWRCCAAFWRSWAGIYSVLPHYEDVRRPSRPWLDTPHLLDGACPPELPDCSDPATVSTEVHSPFMREVFGDGRLVAHENGFAIEAPGLGTPAPLLASTSGQPVPDLSAVVGQVISFTGVLQSTGENLEQLAIHCADLQIPSTETPVSPVWAVVSGNLGKAPEANPKRDRLTASIAYDKIGDATSWLRVTAYTYFSISDLFSKLEAGSGVICYGALESYDYNGKPRVQLSLRGYQELPRSNAPKPPISLMASRSSADTAPHAFDEVA